MSSSRKSASRNVVFQKTTLPSGLRIVSETVPSIRSASLGVWVDVGSRHEQPEESGLSHFIEHMLFKGTKRRTSKELASELESLGGSLNGFTSREQTCYHARFLDKHMETAIDVLADLTCNATITSTHIGREKQVVCEEIKESLDNPSDHIHDVFARSFWGKHPLGQPIMGSERNIKSLSRSRVLEFFSSHYRTESIVVAACGSISHDALVNSVARKFKLRRGAAAAATAAERTTHRNLIVERDKNNQTHFCLGFPAPGYDSKEKISILALSSYLGGGMSSVLFQKIREDRGLAYSVYTYSDFYRDSGIFGTYLATDKLHIEKALAIILTEMRKLKRQKLASNVLAKLKSQMQGHLILGMESTTSRMNRIARQELMSRRYQTLDQVLKEIDKVDASRLMDLANRVFDESKIAMAVLGPVDKDILSGGR